MGGEPVNFSRADNALPFGFVGTTVLVIGMALATAIACVLIFIKQLADLFYHPRASIHRMWTLVRSLRCPRLRLTITINDDEGPASEVKITDALIMGSGFALAVLLALLLCPFSGLWEAKPTSPHQAARPPT
jgi:hypothetical protein